MKGTVDSLRRYPVKGFTPEPIDEADLEAGRHFPGDRLFAVEDGPSGFDPDAPAHLSKMNFTVLARLPGLAAVRTRYDAATGVLTASHPEQGGVETDLGSEDGRAAFAAWLQPIVGDDARGALKVLAAPGSHRFMDAREGFVSIINLESVRDLERRVGRTLDPARFRANVYVDGWPAWAERGLAGADLTLGAARLRGLKPIGRCTATHVDPVAAEVDVDLVAALHEQFGRADCGLYAEVTTSGRVRPGDAADSGA
jgi:uncharacterized protein YcbX